MPVKTPKPPEFLTISLLDEPEVDLIITSLNRPLPEALGAMFMLWAAAVKSNAHENEWILGMSFEQIDQMVGIPGFSESLESVRWLQKLTIAGINAVKITRMTKRPKPPSKRKPIDTNRQEQLTGQEQTSAENAKTLASPLPPSLPSPCSSPLSSLPSSFLSPTPPLHTPTLTPITLPNPHPNLTPNPPPHPSKSHYTEIYDERQMVIFERQVSAKTTSNEGERGQKSSCFATPTEGVISIRSPFSERYPEIDQTLDSDNEQLKIKAETLSWMFVKRYRGEGLYNKRRFFANIFGSIFELIRLKVSPIALKYEIMDEKRDKSEPIWKISKRAENYLINPKFDSYDDVESDYIYHHGKLEDSKDPNGWVSGLERELERNQICQKTEKITG